MRRELRSALPLLLVLVSASACAGDITEKHYKAYPFEADKNNGFVTIFRENHLEGMGADAKLKVKGLMYGYVLNGSGIRVGLPPGQTELDVYTELAPGHLAIPINIQSGKEYYVELQSSLGNNGTLLGYALSRIDTDARQYCGDGWCASIETPEMALPKIRKIKLDAR